MAKYAKTSAPPVFAVRVRTAADPFDDAVAVAKALADPARVRAVAALAKGELCACQIIELLGLAPSTVSRHLAVLRQAGLVRSRKAGRWMHFRRPGDEASPTVAAALQWLDSSLARDPRARQDRARVAGIKREDPEELSRRQCCRGSA